MGRLETSQSANRRKECVVTKTRTVVIGVAALAAVAAIGRVATR